MYDDDDEIKEIKRQVDRNLLKWGSVGVHFVLWIIGSAILSALHAPLLGVLVAGWFGLVVLHGFVLFILDAREHDIKVEVERRLQLRDNGKLKRDRLYRLADDGELVEVEPEDEETPKRLHQS